MKSKINLKKIGKIIPEEEQAENKEAYKEIWVTENEDFLDAIIENVDHLDEIEYLTDALDYETYQEAEVILNNFIDEL